MSIIRRCRYLFPHLFSPTQKSAQKIDVGLSIMFAAKCINEEVEAVLEPIQAEEDQIQPRQGRRRVEHVK